MKSTLKWLVVAVLYIIATDIFADDATPIIVELQEKEANESMPTSSVSIGAGYSVNKEPVFSNPEVFRALLKAGDDPSLNIPLAWDSQRRILHFDINRNGDLTDDGPGWAPSEGSTLGPIFKNIPLSFPYSSNGWIIHTDIEVMTISNRLCATAWIRPSRFLEGTFEIDGNRWRIQVTDRYFHFNAKSGQLPFSYTILPEGLAANAKQLEIPSSDKSTLFLQNRLFRITQGFKHVETRQKRFLQLHPETAETGKIHLKGDYFRYIYLAGAISVHIQNPSPEISVPIGSYASLTALLQNGHQTGQAITKVTLVDIAANKTVELPIGGPLHHHVSAATQFILLEVSYDLVNEFKHPFTLIKTADAKPPRVRILQNDKIVQEDDFRYG